MRMHYVLSVGRTHYPDHSIEAEHNTAKYWID